MKNVITSAKEDLKFCLITLICGIVVMMLALSLLPHAIQRSPTGYAASALK